MEWNVNAKCGITLSGRRFLLAFDDFELVDCQDLVGFEILEVSPKWHQNLLAVKQRLSTPQLCCGVYIRSANFRTKTGLISANLLAGVVTKRSGS